MRAGELPGGTSSFSSISFGGGGPVPCHLAISQIDALTGQESKVQQVNLSSKCWCINCLLDHTTLGPELLGPDANLANDFAPFLSFG